MLLTELLKDQFKAQTKSRRMIGVKSLFIRLFFQKYQKGINFNVSKQFLLLSIMGMEFILFL